MKSIKFILFIALLSSNFNQVLSQCEDGRYHDIIFEQATLESDILYGSNFDYLGVEQDLFLDVYTPTGDAETMRPLVIFIHGGSFVAGSKDGPDVVPLCNDFARMGYTTASIQYRLGIPITFLLEQPATEAAVRGVHDMRAAIRFFRKSVAENGNPYNIDPDEIYLSGVSAGGFVTLHVAYMDEVDEIPTVVDQTSPGLTGGLEGDSGNEGYSSEVNGIVNICGAVGDTTWMKPNDEPVLSFHGPFDTTVPFGSDIQTLGGFPVVDVDGSESVHIKADELGLVNCFEIYEDQGHVPHVANQQFYDTTRAITSNFLAHLVCPDFDLDCEYTELFVVGVDEVKLNKSFLVYPNPAVDEVQMILPESRLQSEITIVDQAGRVMYSGTLEPFKARLELNVQEFATGLYFVQWTDGVVRRTEKLVVGQ